MTTIATKSKDRPILCSAPMVRALLHDVDPKTQTRRAMKPQPHPNFLARGVVGVVPQWPVQDGVRWFMRDGLSELVKCPYGQPGDRLWVRETWGVASGYDRYKPSDLAAMPRMKVAYHASGGTNGVKLRPSIFMPRWASRITLEIVSVRVERLQEISASDAIAEGIERHHEFPESFVDYLHPDSELKLRMTAAGSYRTLWESINGPGSWDANPWCWVLEFKRIDLANTEAKDV